MVHSPAAVGVFDDGDSYTDILIPWQRKLLTRLIQVFAVIGLVAVVPGVYASLQAQAFLIVVLDVGAYAALLPAYLLRTRSYQVSAAVLVGLQLAVGTGLLVSIGVEAASMLWMLAPILIGNLLLRTRSMVVIFGLCLSVIGLVTVLLHAHLVPWTIPLYAWYAIVGTYIALAAILTTATRALLYHLIRGIIYEQELNHELDHRVRNNLQLVNSLILLQSRHLGEHSSQEALTQLNTRISAMGAAFSAVERADRSFRVEMSHLVDRLFGPTAAVGIDGCPVDVPAPPPNIFVSIDTAVPVAIIIAEMVRAGSTCEPDSISVRFTAHGTRDSSVSIRFHSPHRRTEPLIADPLSRDIVEALAGHVGGFSTETRHGEDIEMSLTFRD
ncbi:MAG: histidine kinase dimerization/phosphoacceptor domain -containing protein [Alkalispirochaeta sp.]